MTRLAINGYLRFQRPARLPSIATIRRWANHANAAMEIRPLTSAVTAYRGIDLDAMFGATDPTLLVGGVFRDRGFVSTTLLRQVTRRFAVDLLEIAVPRGTPAAWLERFETRNEFELLLQTDTLFRAEAYDPQDGQRILKVRVVGRNS